MLIFILVLLQVDEGSWSQFLLVVVLFRLMAKTYLFKAEGLLRCFGF